MFHKTLICLGLRVTCFGLKAWLQEGLTGTLINAENRD